MLDLSGPGLTKATLIWCSSKRMILSVLKAISRQDDSTNEKKSCQVGNRLSMRLLEGEFKPGDRIKVSARDEELVFEKK
jgi:hypothetical protein